MPYMVTVTKLPSGVDHIGIADAAAGDLRGALQSLIGRSSNSLGCIEAYSQTGWIQHMRQVSNAKHDRRAYLELPLEWSECDSQHPGIAG